jgi:hypothetical protein
VPMPYGGGLLIEPTLSLSGDRLSPVLCIALACASRFL